MHVTIAMLSICKELYRVVSACIHPQKRWQLYIGCPIGISSNCTKNRNYAYEKQAKDDNVYEHAPSLLVNAALYTMPVMIELSRVLYMTYFIGKATGTGKAGVIFLKLPLPIYALKGNSKGIYRQLLNRTYISCAFRVAWRSVYMPAAISLPLKLYMILRRRASASRKRCNRVN